MERAAAIDGYISRALRFVQIVHARKHKVVVADDANHFLPHFLTEIECLAGGQTER